MCETKTEIKSFFQHVAVIFLSHVRIGSYAERDIDLTILSVCQPVWNTPLLSISLFCHCWIACRLL